MHSSTQHLRKKPSVEDDSLLLEQGRPWHAAIDRDVITELLERKGEGDREHEIGVLKEDVRVQGEISEETNVI